MLEKVKLALRISGNAYDAELLSLIEAAKADLRLVGIPSRLGDALVQRAIITYCRCNFGTPDDYDKVKAAYDEQKAQMMISSAYKG